MPANDVTPDQETPDLTPDQGGAGGDPNGPAVLPAFPPHLLSVATWRDRLRGLIRDRPVPGVTDPAQATVLADADLDDALRQALSALSVHRPAVHLLPPLVLVAGQSIYPLPADFLAPVEATWEVLLRRPERLGHRYALLQRQSMMGAPWPTDTRGVGQSIGGLGSSRAGLLGACPFPLGPFDAQGNIVPGGSTVPHAAFFPADFAHPTPTLVLTPAPTGAHTFLGLTYTAALLARRLSLDSGTGLWAVDDDGTLVSTPVPIGDDFDDTTDVLPCAASEEAVRLALRYAQAWTLTERILELSEVDSEKFPFYEVRSGLNRTAIQRVADDAMTEFNRRTVSRPAGSKQ